MPRNGLFRKTSKFQRKRRTTKFRTLRRRVRTLARRVAGETRIYDRVLADAGVTNAGVFHDLTIMPVGDTDGTREGRTVTAIAMQARLQFEGAGSSEINRMRVMVFQDTTAAYAGGVPTIGDVLDVVDSGGNPVEPVYAPRNRANRGRFKFFYDRIFTVINETIAAGTGYGILREPTPVIKLNLRRAQKVTYTLNTAVIPDSIGTGHIYLLFVSDSALAPNPDVNGAVRFWYTP